MTDVKNMNSNIKNMKRRARLIALYLPQYHPIAENDEWWGKGFTEWISVAKAKPLFRGHEQPKIPGELGFYDLRVEETRIRQAELAQAHGIEGFCYWHYWMGNGKRLLERPFEEVLKTGKPDFPFCLAWANHDWKGRAFGAGDRLLCKQEYPGMEDYKAHFYYLLNAFRDERYITVNDKPLILIYFPKEVPDCKRLTDYWRELALKEGLKGLHIVSDNTSKLRIEQYGLDAVLVTRHRYLDLLADYCGGDWGWLRKILKKLNSPYNILNKYPYEKAMKYYLQESNYSILEYPNIVPNWDTTPRLGRDATIVYGSTPELFRKHVKETLEKVKKKPFEENIVFARAWNEWAEGNYLEPDDKWGSAYLEVLRDEVFAREE